MKKNERLFAAIGDIDEVYLAQAETPLQKRRILPAITAAAACTAFVAAGGMLLYSRLTPPADSEQYNSGTTSMAESFLVYDSGYYEPINWEDLHIVGKFPQLIFEGNTYHGNYSRDSYVVVSPENMGELLGSVTMNGQDLDEEGGFLHTTEAQVYSVRGISQQCAAAVLYNTGECAMFTNDYYRPETLGQFISDLNLRENLVTNTVYDESERSASVRYEDIPTEAVWDILLSHEDAENIDNYDLHWFINEIDISIDIPIFGVRNISLAVTADGWLTTNILATGKAFFIGEEAVNSFISYVRENGTEIRTEYDPLPWSWAEEKAEAGMSSSRPPEMAAEVYSE